MRRLKECRMCIARGLDRNNCCGTHVSQRPGEGGDTAPIVCIHCLNDIDRLEIYSMILWATLHHTIEWHIQAEITYSSSGIS